MFIPQNMVIIGFDLSRSHHFGAQHLSHGEGRRPGASATKLHAGRKKSLDIHRIMDRKITLLWIPVVPHKAVAEVSKIGNL